MGRLLPVRPQEELVAKKADYTMPKMKSGPGRCVHCLKYFKELTSDHVFPESWYPDTTPENLEKWQMPACADCNSRYGRLENDLLQRLGLCLDPQSIRSLGISDKAARAIDPQSAKNEKDRKHRQARREKLLKEILPGFKVSSDSIFPGFEPFPRIPAQEQLAILVSQNQLKALVEKLVRGITYFTTKNYIEATHQIEVLFLHPEAAKPFVDLLKRFGTQHDRGPGIRIIRAIPEDELNSGIFEIEIWGRLRMYAAVRPVQGK